MLADEDHPLEVDGRDPSAAEPQLVVIYRTRGVPWFLIPPLLILAAVAGVVAYRRSAPETPPHPVVITTLVEPPAPPEGPSPARPTTAEVSLPATSDPSPRPAPEPRIAPPEPPPLAASIPAAAVPAPVPVPAPAPPEPSPPTEPTTRDPVGFDPEAAKVEAPAVPAPGATDPLLAGIFREPTVGAGGPPSADAQPEPPLANFEDQNLPRTRMDLIIDASRRAGADRRRFHDDLKSLLAEMGNRAGPEIRMLCDRYGRDTRPEILQMMNRDLVGPAARLSTPARVQRMRRWGVPETIILDDLAEQEENNLKSRGGPRSKGEVWVRAARVLLSMPPKPPAPARSAASPQPR